MPYLAPFQRYSEILVENRCFSLPHLYLAPRCGWSRWNFVKILGISKLQSLCHRMVLFMWS